MEKEKLENNDIYEKFIEEFGKENFELLLLKYKETIEYIISFYQNSDTDFDLFDVNKTNHGLEATFKIYIKNFVLRHKKEELEKIKNGDIPSWLLPINFDYKNKLRKVDDLVNYNGDTFVLDASEQNLLNQFPLEFLRKYTEELGIKIHKEYPRDELLLFDVVAKILQQRNLDFTGKISSYEDFKNELVKLFQTTKRFDLENVSDLTLFPKSTLSAYSEILLDSNAPRGLREKFYSKTLEMNDLRRHKEYASYLLNKNLIEILNIEKKESQTFWQTYINRFGKKEFLDLCSKYGNLLDSISLNIEDITNKDIADKMIRKKISEVTKKGKTYEFLTEDDVFVQEHKEMFKEFNDLKNMSLEEKEKLKDAIISGVLTPNNVRSTFLKNKKIVVPLNFENSPSEMVEPWVANFINVYGLENVLELYKVYGRYIKGINEKLNDITTFSNGNYIDNATSTPISFEKMNTIIKDYIEEKILNGNMFYSPEDIPDFFKSEHPEFFLDDSAPEELKNLFYNQDRSYGLSFDILKEHKDWLLYLKNKNIEAAFLRSVNLGDEEKLYNQYYPGHFLTEIEALKNEVKKYFAFMGQEKGLELGINKKDTVNEMIKSKNVNTLRTWYEMTGKRFIPDYVIMQNFDSLEIDKFLSNGMIWSNLMKLKNISSNDNSREALLKLAYSFGAFDNDKRGLTKLNEILTDLPRKVSKENGYIFDKLDKDFLKEEGLFDSKTLDSIHDALGREKVSIDLEKGLFNQIYRKNEDGTYTLTKSKQKYPRTVQVIRGVLENYDDFPMLTPNKMALYFDTFDMDYNPSFREFFLSNFEKIIDDKISLSKISLIQKQFREIKKIYSNIPLTLDIAMSYVDANRYVRVNPGNENVTKIAATSNYSQKDFETLQRIYNYSKKRIFSSIPRIKNKLGGYTYEFLKIDDPYAMSVGILTDCCQQLGQPGELCMEHSMTDKNGRIFIVKDEKGELVAQSWVWRNNDVLCFDNIEVPNKKMLEHDIKRGKKDEGVRNSFTDEVLEVYKKAAKEIMEEDEKRYNALLESGRITKEEYDGLKLKKITVGEGHSNIKGSFVTLKRENKITRSIPFTPPVRLTKDLYTKDSDIQYILEEREGRTSYDGLPLAIYDDEFSIYTDANADEKMLLTLQKLELLTKSSKDLKMQISDRYARYDKDHIITTIAKRYGLDEKNARLIVTSNFAILYAIDGDNLKIGDLLFNTEIDDNNEKIDIEKETIMQINMAMNQIGKDKNIDISLLNEKQKEVYEKATSIGTEKEINMERGFKHVK